MLSMPSTGIYHGKQLIYFKGSVASLLAAVVYATLSFI